MLKSQIHRKKPARRPMPVRTARANARKSAVRAHIEHVFAEQKARMGLFVRTIGLAMATEETQARLHGQGARPGGVITTAISWRAAFLFQAAVVVTIILLSRRMVDPLAPDPTRPFDAVGAVLSGVGMFCVVFGILQAGSNNVLLAVFLAIGAIFLVAFFLFIRALPMISIFEVRLLLPKAKAKQEVH